MKEAAATATPDTLESTRRLARFAMLLSLALLVVRLNAADVLGFGDAEALYASYALHPQAVYLDHPGLIGVIARAIGGGQAPSPAVAHRFTSFVVTLVPWLGAWAARAVGASWRGALYAAIALLVTPEIAIGLFAMTPDLPLCVLWYASLGLAGFALSSRPGSVRALVGFLGAGFAAGLAFDAKASGALLVLGLGLAFAAAPARAHLRTLGPWAALVLAALAMAPVVGEEVARGFPMLHHRLVATPHGGPSLRNLGALVGGQLLYVTPVLLLAAWKVLRDLYARRSDDPSSALLFWTTVATTPLVVLALSSRVAEPHWIAPLYLALPLHFARRAGDSPAPVSPRLARWAAGVGIAAIALVQAWVLYPIGPRLLGRRYEARYDLANDLFAWKDGIGLVTDALRQGLEVDGPPPVVVGPHWIVCAQLRAGLPASVLVGCDGAEPADFESWLPKATWQKAPVVLYVTDDRFAVDPSRVLPDRGVESSARVSIRRGNAVVRRISVHRLVLGAHASR